MTILSIAQNVCLTLGMAVPDEVTGSTLREMNELQQFITETCSEVARRVQWGDLTKEQTLTGDGTAIKHDLATDFDRLTGGVCVVGSGGVVRPLTQSEWPSITSIAGVPRYFLLQDDTIKFHPFLPIGATVQVSYQSANFVDGTASTFTNDAQSPIFDQRLVEAGTVARWRRQKGMPYQDFEAEYEALIAQQAQYDDRGRF